MKTEMATKTKQTREAREGYYSELVRNRSFKEIQEVLNERQKEVYNIISLYGPIYSELIAAHLKIYPHQVSPLVQELRWLGLVVFDSIGISTVSKKEVSRWRAVAPPAADAVQTEMTFTKN